MDATASTTINAPAHTIYETWCRFDQLPQFMYHLETVTPLDDRRSHWVAKAPAGTTVEWNAEIVDEVPDTRLAWRSVEGSEISNAGEVRFEPAPGDRGTEIHVALSYTAPAGALGTAVAKLFGEEPNQQLRDDLRRFKQLIETGEIARSDGSPAGTRARNKTDQEAAQPVENVDQEAMA
jgi:uncharacterized membrane protein